MKNKWIQSLALGLVMTLLVMTPSIGEEVSKTINIESLEELITVSSLDIEIAKNEVEIAEYKYDIAEDNINSGFSALEIQKNKSYNFDEAEMNLAYAKSNLDEIIATTLLDGKTQIYTYLLTEDEIKLYESQVERLTQERTNLERKVELGLSLQSDVDSKDLEIQKAELAIKGLEIELNQIQLTLNQYLRWDLETVIEVIDIELPELGKLDFKLSEIKDNQLLYNYELLKLIDEKALTSENLVIQRALGNDDDSDTIISAKEAIEDARYAIADKELNVEMNVYSTYNSLLNLRDDITLKQLEVENAASDYNRLSKRFEVGFETQASLDAAKESLAFAELALEQANLDYYVAYEGFIRLGEVPE